MTIQNTSSISSVSSYFNTTKAATSTAAATTTTSTQTDSVSFSKEGIARSKMPPPPEKADIENMSEDEFKTYLEEMQNAFGQLPGIEEGTTVAELDDEAIATLKEVFTKMAAEGPQQQGGGPGGPGGPRGAGGPPPVDVQTATDEEIEELLQKILERTGEIPGVEDATSVEALTDEQLTSAKKALTEQQEQMQEKMNNMLKERSAAISAYDTAMQAVAV